MDGDPLAVEDARGAVFVTFASAAASVFDGPSPRRPLAGFVGDALAGAAVFGASPGGELAGFVGDALADFDGAWRGVGLAAALAADFDDARPAWPGAGLVGALADAADFDGSWPEGEPAGVLGGPSGLAATGAAPRAASKGATTQTERIPGSLTREGASVKFPGRPEAPPAL